MGNWRTVYITGMCDKVDLPALIKAVDIGDDWSNFHSLCFCGPSLCGVGNWPAEVINAIGNLAERDYGVADVVRDLQKLVEVAPSLTIKIHCGGDWEDRACVATVISSGDGKPVIAALPEIAQLPEISETQYLGNFFQAILR